MFFKVFKALAIMNISFIAIAFILFMLVDSAISLPIEVEKTTELAIVKSKDSETMSVTVLRDDKRMLVVLDDENLYHKVEVGKEVIVVSKQYRRLTGETLETVTVKSLHDYAAEVGAVKFDDGPRAGVMNVVP